jgi:TetR/AcrR family transcriptional repressor of bet genes
MPERLPVERRQQFIDATINAIAKYGFGEATVQKIAREIGLTAANVHHNFGDKAGLIEATMKALMRLIADENARESAKAVTAREKLAAVVRANLSSSLFETNICRAWLHFWVHAPHRPELQRLERINAGRLRSNLVRWLSDLMGHDEAVPIASHCATVIDGLWIGKALGTVDLTPQAAQSIVINFLDDEIARCSVAQLRSSGSCDGTAANTTCSR